MANHIDCNCKRMPVPLSCVVQGIYDSGDTTTISDGSIPEILGTLDCQDRKKVFPVEAVSLMAGDALVLAGAWHQPRPVQDGAKRLVFVLFFSELYFVR